VVVGFELLIQNSNSVPQLGILDIFERIKSVLIGIKRAMALFSQEIAMAKGCPGRSVRRKDLSHPLVVLDGGFIVTFGGTELSKSAQVVVV